MLKPQIIEKIVDPNTGKVIRETEPEVVGRPISKETARQVRKALETVVSSPKGTGYGKYNIEGYKVAGKTGTASFTEDGSICHGGNNYIFSFLGMAPADEPELIVYVAVQQPQTENNTGGANAVSMAFKMIMQNSLQYLNVEPSEQQEAKPLCCLISSGAAEEAAKEIEAAEEKQKFSATTTRLKAAAGKRPVHHAR